MLPVAVDTVYSYVVFRRDAGGFDPCDMHAGATPAFSAKLLLKSPSVVLRSLVIIRMML
jgi:hypothetical protein